ncbi:TPA: response regulator transcription factor [Escherichia coli]|nr:response regulator transcription factor [Escherichia coli O5]MBB7735346.1 response regulator transcription factor [Escherichia coli]RDP83132.1 Cyclic di-GMP phosphodiesterase YahA [Escherichia coli]HBA7339111.1 response regulator transcription factor [Escherichia coli]
MCIHKETDNIKNSCYIRSYLEQYNITVHMWIFKPLTETECNVLELLIKGYNVTKISVNRFRSVKTVSLQKSQIYRKLGVRNDITFWLDLSLSPYTKLKLTKGDAEL